MRVQQSSIGQFSVTLRKGTPRRHGFTMESPGLTPRTHSVHYTGKTTRESPGFNRPQISSYSSSL